MKKIVSIVLVLTMVMSLMLAGCVNSDNSADDDNDTTVDTDVEKPIDDKTDVDTDTDTDPADTDVDTDTDTDVDTDTDENDDDVYVDDHPDVDNTGNDYSVLYTEYQDTVEKTFELTDDSQLKTGTYRVDTARDFLIPNNHMSFFDIMNANDDFLDYAINAYDSYSYIYIDTSRTDVHYVYRNVLMTYITPEDIGVSGTTVFIFDDYTYDPVLPNDTTNGVVFD